MPTEKTAKIDKSDIQRKAILEIACQLFIERGFGGTSLNDISDAMGVSRTSLYYYFASKEALLVDLTIEVTQQARALGKAVLAQKQLPPQEALQQLIRQHAALIMRNPQQFRVVERSEVDLPEPHRSNAQAARRDILASFVRVLERGVSAGVFEANEVQVSAFLLIGMCNWSAWWYVQKGPITVEAAASYIAEAGLRTVLIPVGKASRSTASAINKLNDARLLIDQVNAQLQRAVEPAVGK